MDQACVDLVYVAPDGRDLIARMESRHGVHTLEHAEAIGLGSRTYTLVTIQIGYHENYEHRTMATGRTIAGWL